jgi:hypothetical protein
MTAPPRKQAHKRELAIAALLTCPTIGAAANAAGLGEKTLRRWLHDPAFAATYAAARRQALEHTVGALQGATGAAVEALRRNTDPSKPAGIQIRAANALLTLAFRGIETFELMTKLEDLEGRLAAVEPTL